MDKQEICKAVNRIVSIARSQPTGLSIDDDDLQSCFEIGFEIYRAGIEKAARTIDNLPADDSLHGGLVVALHAIEDLLPQTEPEGADD